MENLQLSLKVISSEQVHHNIEDEEQAQSLQKVALQEI